MTKAERGRYALAGIILLLVSAALVRPLLMLPGPPAYRHDWYWPLVPPPLSALGFGYSAWSPQNLGSPNLYPTTAPLTAWMVLGSQALGVRASLDLFVLLAAFGAACGAARLFDAVQPNRPLLAAGAGTLYVSLPAFTDQLIAGHCGDLVAYAAFPWLIASSFRFLRTGGATDFLAALLAGSVAAVQMQYQVLCPFAMIVLACVYRSKRSFALVAGVAGFILACNAVVVFQVVRDHAGGPIFQQEHAILTWENAQSAEWPEALRAGGYTAGYDRAFASAAGWLSVPMQAVLFALPLGLLGFLRLGDRARERAALLILGTVGFIAMTGMKSPLGGMFAWMFLHVQAASLFRELFHFAPLYALSLSVGFAAAVDAVGAFAALRAGAPFIAILLGLCAGAGQYAGAAGRFLQAAPPTGEALRMLEVVRKAREPWRLVVEPGRQPVRMRVGQASGLDPLAYYPIGSAWNMFEYFPLPGQGLPSALTYHHREREARAFYELMSVRYKLERPETIVDFDAAMPQVLVLGKRRIPDDENASSSFVVDEHALPEVYGSGVPALVGGDYARLLRGIPVTTLAFMRMRPAFARGNYPYTTESADSQDLQLAEGCAALEPLKPSFESADPREAWQSAGRLALQDPALEYPVTSTVVTQSPAAVAAAAGREGLFALLDGSGRSSYLWGRLPDNAPQGYALAVAGVLMPSRSSCVPLRAGKERGALVVEEFHRPSATALSGTFRMRGSAGTLVFTDAFNADWKLWTDGRNVADDAHFAANGFANGWVLTVPSGEHTFEIRLAHARLFGLLALGSVLCWWSVALFFFVRIIRSRRNEARASFVQQV